MNYYVIKNITFVYTNILHSVIVFKYNFFELVRDHCKGKLK